MSYSDNKTPWEAHREMASYLAKLPHVSSACRLSDSEEIAILRLCRQATPLLKNRLDFLIASEAASGFARRGGHESAALLSDASSGEGTSVVDLKGPAPRWGGQPWRKLCSASLHYLNAYATKMK